MLYRNANVLSQLSLAFGIPRRRAGSAFVILAGKVKIMEILCKLRALERERERERESDHVLRDFTPGVSTFSQVFCISLLDAQRVAEIFFAFKIRRAADLSTSLAPNLSLVSSSASLPRSFLFPPKGKDIARVRHETRRRAAFIRARFANRDSSAIFGAPATTRVLRKRECHRRRLVIGGASAAVGQLSRHRREARYDTRHSRECRDN